MLKDSEALLGSERDKERLISDQERKGRKCLGKDPATKSDDFLEKFQAAFDPPPHFWKIMLQIFWPKVRLEVFQKFIRFGSGILP